MQADTKENIEAAMGHMRTLLDQVNALETMFPGRHFTLDGHLVGSVGEGIAVSAIQSVYPMIEEYREDFVDRHWKAIDASLPIESSFGEMCNDPQDLELGTDPFDLSTGFFIINP